MAETASPIPPPEACFGLWVTEDRTRAMRIVRGEDGDARVTVWTCEPFQKHMIDCAAKWHPPIESKRSSTYARERVGYLEAGDGDFVLGAGYVLMLATRNADPSACGGFEWGPIAIDTPRAEARIFPERSASYYESMVGYWDDAAEAMRESDDWMMPLSTWLPVAPT